MSEEYIEGMVDDDCTEYKLFKPPDPSPTPHDHSTWGFYCDTCDKFFDLVRDGRVVTAGKSADGQDCYFVYGHKACDTLNTRYIGYER